MYGFFVWGGEKNRRNDDLFGLLLIIFVLVMRCICLMIFRGRGGERGEEGKRREKRGKKRGGVCLGGKEE